MKCSRCRKSYHWRTVLQDKAEFRLCYKCAMGLMRRLRIYIDYQKHRKKCGAIHYGHLQQKPLKEGA